jgi:hypothetical protein
MRRGGIIGVFCAGLAACGGFAGIALEAPEPRDFEGAGVQVRVDPIDGPAIPMARLVAQSVATGLSGLNVAAAAKVPGLTPYVLKGRAEVNRSNPKLPFVVLIHWTLFDADGDTVALHTQGVPGSWRQWEYGDPRVIDAVGASAAKPIAALIHAGGR